MPVAKTRADSVREYYTGAAGDGMGPVAPASSLGGFRSTTEARSLSIMVVDPINYIMVLYAGGGNAVGAGDLNVLDGNIIQWRCAGGAYGAGVPITNGETKIVETAGVPGAYLRIMRTSSIPLLEGTATVNLAVAVDNDLFDDVSSAVAITGGTIYRGTTLLNESPTYVNAFKRWIGTIGTPQVSNGGGLGAGGAGFIVTTGTYATWPDSGWCHIKTNVGVTREIIYYSSRSNTVLTVPAAGRARLGTAAAAGAATDVLSAVPGIALALEPGGVTAGGLAVQTIANENTAPAGVAWVTGITPATGLQIGAMGAGKQIGVWVKREIPAGAVATTEAAVVIQDSYEAA